MKISARGFRAATFPLAYLAKGVVSVASALHGWTVDRRREVRIRDLRLAMHRAHAAGDRLSVQRLGRLMFAECDARSPRQVARMEQKIIDRMDPHARAIFERRRVQ